MKATGAIGQVFEYDIYPFAYMDFASVARGNHLCRVSHAYLGYESPAINAQRAVEECLTT